jgi:hypothetical protein
MPRRLNLVSHNYKGFSTVLNERQWQGVVAGVAYLHNHTSVLVHGDLKSVCRSPRNTVVAVKMSSLQGKYPD